MEVGNPVLSQEAQQVESDHQGLVRGGGHGPPAVQVQRLWGGGFASCSSPFQSKTTPTIPFAARPPHLQHVIVALEARRVVLLQAGEHRELEGLACM